MSSSLREFLETIKVEHTIFALPFAYMTMFLVSEGWPTLADFLWITLAMVSGRTLGMAANRIIDAEIDARNPRTADRAIAAGRLGKGSAIGFMLVTLVLFLVPVYQLAPLCRRLWPLVIIAMIVYPYAKRFTWLAHLFLGVVYFMIPTAIWVAVANTASIASIMLGIGAALWVVGFDIIYSCQDAESDRREGLHSMPADLGLSAALWISRIFHGAFVGLLWYAGHLLDTGWLYTTGVIMIAALLAWEHSSRFAD